MPDAQMTKPPRGTSSEAASGKRRQQRHSTDDAEQWELFDKPPIAPTLPGRRTLAYQVLLHLLAGEAVTQPLWLDLAGSWRLAASIKVLDYLGWPIKATSIPAPTPETPKRVIAQYRMAREGIEAGRELLRQARRAAT